MSPVFSFTNADLTRWLGVLLDAAAKGLVILAVAFVATWLLRRRSAALRHAIWTLSVAALMAVPLLSVALPQLQVPILPDWPRPTSPPIGPPAETATPPERLPAEAPVEVPVLPAFPVVQESPVALSAPPAHERPALANIDEAPQPPAQRQRHWSMWVLLAWASGAVVMFIPLLVGTVTIWWRTRRVSPAAGPGWTALLNGLRESLGVRRSVRLLRSTWSNIPLTCGIFRPVIVLPAEADDWPGQRRRVVLLHELAHVKRADCLTQLVARLARVVYWFNPLVWLAGRMLRIERERACDDLVLSAGHKASDYAGHLLDIVRTLHSVRCPSMAAVAMVRKSQFEGRLLAILDPRRNRRALTRISVLVAAILVAAVAVPISILRASKSQKRITLENVQQVAERLHAGVGQLTLDEVLEICGHQADYSLGVSGEDAKPFQFKHVMAYDSIDATTNERVRLRVSVGDNRLSRVLVIRSPAKPLQPGDVALSAREPNDVAVPQPAMESATVPNGCVEVQVATRDRQYKRGDEINSGEFQVLHKFIWPVPADGKAGKLRVTARDGTAMDVSWGGVTPLPNGEKGFLFKDFVWSLPAPLIDPLNGDRRSFGPHTKASRAFTRDFDLLVTSVGLGDAAHTQPNTASYPALVIRARWVESGETPTKQPGARKPRTYTEILAGRGKPDLEHLASRVAADSTRAMKMEDFHDLLKLREVGDEQAVAVLKRIIAADANRGSVFGHSALQALYCIGGPAAKGVLGEYLLKDFRYSANSAYGYTLSWEMPEPQRGGFIRDYLLKAIPGKLAVELKANAAADGRSVTFTMTLRNVSDAPLQMRQPQVYLGRHIYLRTEKGQYLESTKTIDYDPLMPRRLALKPNQSRDFTFTAKLAQATWREQTVLQSQDYQWFLPQPGPLTAVAMFEQSPLTGQQRQAAKVEAPWVGRAVSQPVSFRIGSPAPPAAVRDASPQATTRPSSTSSTSSPQAQPGKPVGGMVVLDRPIRVNATLKKDGLALLETTTLKFTRQGRWLGAVLGVRCSAVGEEACQARLTLLDANGLAFHTYVKVFQPDGIPKKLYKDGVLQLTMFPLADAEKARSFRLNLAMEEVRPATTRPPSTNSTSSPQAGSLRSEPAGPKTGQADPAQIERLIEQLGSDKYRDRKDAQAALAKIGLPAVDPLLRATADNDPERRGRAKATLEQIEVTQAITSRALLVALWQTEALRAGLPDKQRALVARLLPQALAGGKPNLSEQRARDLQQSLRRYLGQFKRQFTQEYAAQFDPPASGLGAAEYLRGKCYWTAWLLAQAATREPIPAKMAQAVAGLHGQHVARLEAALALRLRQGGFAEADATRAAADFARRLGQMLKDLRGDPLFPAFRSSPKPGWMDRVEGKFPDYVRDPSGRRLPRLIDREEKRQALAVLCGYALAIEELLPKVINKTRAWGHMKVSASTPVSSELGPWCIDVLFRPFPAMNRSRGWTPPELSPRSAQATQPTAMPTLGAVIKQTLSHVHVPGATNVCIDFDTGRVFPEPPVPPELSSDEVSDARGAWVSKWRDKTGVDAVAANVGTPAQESSLYGLSLRAVAIDPEQWDTLSSDKAEQLLNEAVPAPSQYRWQKRSKEPNRKSYLLPIKPHSSPPFTLLPYIASPMVLKTAEGSLALLEIVSIDPKKQTCQIRYKLLKHGQPAAKDTPDALQLAALWEELAGDDYEKAYQAARQLVAGGDESVEFLRGRIKAVSAKPEVVKQLIADLGAGKQAVRTAAFARLSLIGLAARAELQEASRSSDAEVRRSARRLLEASEHPLEPTATQQQVTWALRVLETIDTSPARELLTTAAGGTPQAWLSLRAKASLAQLAEADKLSEAKGPRQLSFRMMPNPDKVGPWLPPEKLRQYVKALSEKGPGPTPTKGSEEPHFRWFEADCELPPSPYVAIYKGRRYVLLWNLANRLPYASSNEPWEVIRILPVKDALHLPAIRFELGRHVRNHLKNMTEQGSGNYMAALADDKVVSLVKVTQELPGEGVITGLFSARRARGIVEAVRVGMIPVDDFHETISAGYLPRIREMLDHYPSIVRARAIRNYRGATPLHTAMARKKHDIADLLLQRGADVNALSSSGQTPLHYMAYKPEAIKFLLAHKADVHALDANGATALHKAVMDNPHKDAAEALIDGGADVNATGKIGLTPLAGAVITKGWGGSPEDIQRADACIELLLSRGAKLDAFTAAGLGKLKALAKTLARDPNPVTSKPFGGLTPLHLAALLGQTPAVEMLLKREADPNATVKELGTPLHAAARKGHVRIVQLLLEHKADVAAAEADDGEMPIHVAAEKGRTEVVKLLLAAGAEANAKTSKGNTPLHSAAARGHKDTVELLLSKGADPKAATKYGKMPLHILCSNMLAAVRPGRIEPGQDFVGAARLLIDKGADVNAVYDGRTPLHLAAGRDIHSHRRKEMPARVQLVRLLVSSGADVNAPTRNNREMTPLHVAAQSGDPALVKTLLELGASPFVESRWGGEHLLPSEMIDDHGIGTKPQILKLLAEHEAPRLQAATEKVETTARSLLNAVAEGDQATIKALTYDGFTVWSNANWQRRLKDLREKLADNLAARQFVLVSYVRPSWAEVRIAPLAQPPDGKPKCTLLLMMNFPDGKWRLMDQTFPNHGLRERLGQQLRSVDPIGHKRKRILDAFAKKQAARPVKFQGLDLSASTSQTSPAKLPDLFEQRPPGSHSYELVRDARVAYSGLDGTVYYLPKKNIFYLQCDPLGSSTRTYYGPFQGDPAKVLSLPANDGATPEGASTQPAIDADKAAVTEAALRFLKAVKDNDLGAMKSLSAGAVQGWGPDHKTMRRANIEGEPPMGWSVEWLEDAGRELAREVLARNPDVAKKVLATAIAGDFAATRSPALKQGSPRYLIVVFVRTDQGWRFATMDDARESLQKELAKHAKRIPANLERIRALAAQPPGGAKYDIRLENVDIRSALKRLAKQCNRSIIPFVGKGSVSVDLHDVTFTEALQAIVQKAGYAWVEHNGVVFVGKAEFIRNIRKLATQPAVRDSSLQAPSTSSPQAQPAGIEGNPRIRRYGNIIALGGNATDADLASLGEAPGIVELRISGGKRWAAGLRITGAGLANLSRWTDLKALILIGAPVHNSPRYPNITHFTDAGLVHLRRLTKLEKLVLVEQEITDDGLANLSGLTELRELHLDFIPLSDAGLKHLAGLRKLKVLRFYRANISDTGLAHLKDMVDMENLQLGRAKVTDKGLTAIIGRMHKLKALDLQSNLISDEGLSALANLTNLQWLALDNTPITDVGLKQVAKLHKLEYLFLEGTGITDAGLARLAGLKQLKRLKVQNTAVTTEGIRRLKLALPELEIVSSTPPAVRDSSPQAPSTSSPQTGARQLTEAACQKMEWVVAELGRLWMGARQAMLEGQPADASKLLADWKRIAMASRASFRKGLLNVMGDAAREVAAVRELLEAGDANKAIALADQMDVTPKGHWRLEDAVTRTTLEFRTDVLKRLAAALKEYEKTHHGSWPAELLSLRSEDLAILDEDVAKAISYHREPNSRVIQWSQPNGDLLELIGRNWQLSYSLWHDPVLLGKAPDPTPDHVPAARYERGRWRHPRPVADPDLIAAARYERRWHRSQTLAERHCLRYLAKEKDSISRARVYFWLGCRYSSGLDSKAGEKPDHLKAIRYFRAVLREQPSSISRPTLWARTHLASLEDKGPAQRLARHLENYEFFRTLNRKAIEERRWPEDDVDALVSLIEGTKNSTAFNTVALAASRKDAKALLGELVKKYPGEIIADYASKRLEQIPSLPSPSAPPASPAATQPAASTSSPPATQPVDATKASQLFNAIRAGNIDTVRKMLKANPALAKARNNLRYTPLHQTAAARRPNRKVLGIEVEGKPTKKFRDNLIRIAQLLLDAGADIEAKGASNQHNGTPLHLAAYYGAYGDWPGMVEFLLARGADVNAKANDGETPLHALARAENKQNTQTHLAIAKALLDAGANPLAGKGLRNRWPVEIARGYANRVGGGKVYELLRKHTTPLVEKTNTAINAAALAVIEVIASGDEKAIAKLTDGPDTARGAIQMKRQRTKHGDNVGKYRIPVVTAFRNGWADVHLAKDKDAKRDFLVMTLMQFPNGEWHAFELLAESREPRPGAYARNCASLNSDYWNFVYDAAGKTAELTIPPLQTLSSTSNLPYMDFAVRDGYLVVRIPFQGGYEQWELEVRPGLCKRWERRFKRLSLSREMKLTWKDGSLLAKDGRVTLTSGKRQAVLDVHNGKVRLAAGKDALEAAAITIAPETLKAKAAATPAWDGARSEVKGAPPKEFARQMALAEQTRDRSQKVVHLRKALAARPNDPFNIVAEYALAIQLKQFWPGDTAESHARRAARAKAILQRLVKQYDHMRYYTSHGPDSARESEILVPQSLLILAGMETDYLKIRPLSYKAMRCLSRTSGKRRKEWTDAPKPTKPAAPFGGPMREAKWKSRVAMWERRRQRAAGDEVLGRFELELAEQAVRKFALSHVLGGPDAIDDALRRVRADFPGTAMAHFAQAHLDRGRVEVMPPVLPTPPAAGDASPQAPAATQAGVRTHSQIPPQLEAQRDKLLAEADAKIRKGIVQLAEKFPHLKQAGGEYWEVPPTPSSPGIRQQGRYWRSIRIPSRPGSLSISLYNTDKGKAATTREPMPPKQRVRISIVVRGPRPEPAQLSMWALYPNLGLVGQIGVSAGHPDLDAALKKLVNEALEPLKQLNDKTAAKPTATRPALRDTSPQADRNASP